MHAAMPSRLPMDVLRLANSYIGELPQNNKLFVETDACRARHHREHNILL